MHSQSIARYFTPLFNFNGILMFEGQLLTRDVASLLLTLKAGLPRFLVQLIMAETMHRPQRAPVAPSLLAFFVQAGFEKYQDDVCAK